jgi:probable phosphomutase (TIGR03848 family)
VLLLLVRHALTPQTGRLLTGWLPGHSLSEEGRRQAEALAERLGRLPLDAVYASPLERTVETARPLAAAAGVRVRVREGIGEVRYGDWEGRPLRALARTRLWRELQARPSAVRFPGGEALPETQARAVATVEEIRAAHPRGRVAAVTHADVIRLVLAHYAGIHIDLYQRLAIAPASVSALWLGDGGPRVLKVNDTGGLDGLGPPRRAAARRNR